MLAIQEKVKFPDRGDIKVNQIPGNVLNRVEQVSNTERIYYSADGNRRVVDIIVGKNNPRRVLILEVRVNDVTHWEMVMQVVEQRSPKGKKIQKQDLWINGIDANGVLRVHRVNDDGGLSVTGLPIFHGIKLIDSGVSIFHDPQEASQLKRLGVYVESSLPSRIDRVATMQNFFKVVCSGSIIQPNIVPLH